MMSFLILLGCFGLLLAIVALLVADSARTLAVSNKASLGHTQELLKADTTKLSQERTIRDLLTVVMSGHSKNPGVSAAGMRALRENSSGVARTIKRLDDVASATSHAEAKAAEGPRPGLEVTTTPT